MLEINLLPVREARRAADVRQLTMQVVLMLLVTFGLIAIVHSRLSDDVGMAKARVAQMENDIKQFKPQLDQVAKFRKKKTNLEQKIDVIDGLSKARSGPVLMMSELASRTPDRLWLRKLSTKGLSVTLQGSSLDNELVALFLRALDESSNFTDVDLGSTELGRQKDGGVKVVNFDIEATIVTESASEEPKKQKKGKAVSKKTG